MVLAIIAAIQEKGCTVKAKEGSLVILPPSGREFTDDTYTLIEQLKDNKREALKVLSDFIEIPPSEGELHAASFCGEASLKRWGIAYRAGLIALQGKLLVNRQTSQCKISYRCAIPLEWLEEEITLACKREYDKLLVRIQNGTEWLRTHEDDPSYQRYYDGYLRLYEELRLLAAAVGEVLDDPLAGYTVNVLPGSS